ncbi:MAG TPA: lysylphosphatidylglycerol synthase transmembrane domain-containing protein [Chloroflexota bacterium]|nr:lysylphosphatidylglycerol synthase transmembrane domain-containing protein [Chloroflexota bacterium]
MLSLFSLGVLAALLTQSDWREATRPLVEARPEWLLAAVVLALLVEVAKTVRWQLLLGVGPRVLPQLLSLVFTARLLNALVPLRAGDVWRVASVVKAEGRPLLRAGGSVVVEKLLDGALVGGLSLALIGKIEIGGMKAGLLAVVALAALVLFLVVCSRNGLLRSFAERVGQRNSTVAGLLQLSGERWRVSDARSLLLIAEVAGLTMAGMILGLLVNLAALEAMGLPQGLMAAAVMLVSGYAVGLVPSGPAQLGVYELAVSAPLMTLGLPPASAVSAALALHLVLLVALGIGGMLALLFGYLAGRRCDAGMAGV